MNHVVWIEEAVALTFHQYISDVETNHLDEPHPQVLDGYVMCTLECDESWPFVDVEIRSICLPVLA